MKEALKQYPIHCGIAFTVKEFGHLFLNGSKLKLFNSNITFSLQEIFLGIHFENFMAFNCIFIICKQYLYACRCLESKPNFQELVTKILYYKNVEKYIATKNGKLQLHNSK